MDMVLANMPRWIFASVTNHFNTQCSAYPVYIEGFTRRTNKEESHIEIRVDGPRIIKYPSQYYFYGEVNLLISCLNSENYHKIHEMAGIVAASFVDISVYKYGDGVYDTGQYVGCYKLIQKNRGHDRVEINHFGIIEPDQSIVQATVEGHYKMFVSW